MTKKRNRRPQPLAPPPQSSTLRSRKRARQATTLFHKYTQERDAAVARAKAGGCHTDDDSTQDGNSAKKKQRLSSIHIALLDEVKKWDDKISDMGGREEYQRASQMNTSLFSTSKWVLGIFGRWGWLDGLAPGKDTKTDSPDDAHAGKKRKKEKVPRRNVRLLEVGAINTQLLDAAARTRPIKTHTTNNEDKSGDTDGQANTPVHQKERVYHLDVKAIDIRSTDPRIEQANFFDLPLPQKDQLNPHHYDAIVNSMVINCVTTPAQRGTMLSLCYKQLRPGGILFLTLPRLCLIQSKFMSRSYFEEVLTKGVGFEIVQEVARESPKVAFFVLRRPSKEEEGGEDSGRKWNAKYTGTKVLHHGKKFRNTFAVTLNKEEVAC